MRVLLDTHAWLWLLIAPDRLGPTVVETLRSPDNEPMLSAASSWQIAIKYSLGKLALPEPPTRYVPEQLAADGITPLPVEHAHALRVATLPLHHTDPFDRLLVAQAQIEGVPIVTADTAFDRYDVEVLTAT